MLILSTTYLVGSYLLFLLFLPGQEEKPGHLLLCPSFLFFPVSRTGSNRLGRLGTNQTLGVRRKPSMADSKRECLFLTIIGFLPELLSVCLCTICLTTHSLCTMDVPVRFRSLM